MFCSRLGPKAPLGEPFSSNFFHQNLLRDFLGGIPIVGIFVGAKRILAVSQYFGSLEQSEHKISRVIVAECGDEHYKVVDALGYKLGHYLRGTLEILGLGCVVTIVELALKLFVLLVLGLSAVLTIPYVAIMGVASFIAFAIQEVFFTSTKCIRRTDQEEASQENPCACFCSLPPILTNQKCAV